MSQDRRARALVTGGAGFLGPHLVERLLKRGWCVAVIDNLFNGRREHMTRFLDDPRFRFAQGDIVDSDFLTRTVIDFQPDAVFHLAAIHFIPYCIAHPSETLRVNIVGTQLLLDALRKTQVHSVVLASTADAYAPSEVPHSESDPLRGGNIYGLSKITNEQMFRLAEVYNPEVRFSVARLANLFGPGETNPHVLPDIMAELRHGSVLRLGNLEPRRDYVYVGDVAEALLMIAAYQGNYRTFNVSTGTGVSVSDLVRAIERVTGTTLRIEIDVAKVRPIERMCLVLNNSLIRCEVNWQTTVTLEEGLRRTFAVEESEKIKAATAACS